MALINVKTIAKAKDRNSMVTKGGVVYQSVDTAALAEVANIAKNLASNSSDWTKIDQKDKAVLAAALKSLAEALEEIAGKYLSKVHDDAAEGVIKFLSGAVFGNFVSGLLGGKIDELGNGELENLLVRDSIVVPNLTVTKAAHFFKLIIDELKSIGGQIIVTAANATLDKVVAYTAADEVAGDGDAISYWRCYFRAKDGNRAIHNQFEVNDQAVCMTFDAAEGTSYNVSNKYYWRKVLRTGTVTMQNTDTGEDDGYHYIDLSYSDKDPDCNGEPEAGDAVAQLGNRTATSRQNAIIISAYDGIDATVQAPSIVQYREIDDYSLSTHKYNVIAANGNEFHGQFVSIARGSGQEQNLDDLIEGLNDQVEAVKGQVDNKFEIWYGNGVPTLNNEPAVNWTDTETRDTHLQDIYYDRTREPAANGGNAYRFELNNGTYGWSLITDEHTLMALNKISDVAADDKLTGGMEKTRVYIEWMAAVQDYLKYKQQATKLGLISDTVWTEYLSALNALGNYLNGSTGTAWNIGNYSGVETSDNATPAWINASNRDVTTTNIGANNYRGYWNAYYEKLSALLSAMGVETYNYAETKANVFVTSYNDTVPNPTPPYKAGDLWLYTQPGGQQKMFIAKVTRTSGSFNRNDWEDMTAVVVQDDVRTNLARMLDELFDISDFAARWNLQSTTDIPFYICDNIAYNDHFCLDNGTVYRYLSDTERQEVILAEGDLVYDNGAVYMYKRVQSGNTTTLQLVDLNANDLALTMLTILNSVGSRAIVIWKSLSNSAHLYDVSAKPNTFTPVTFNDGTQQGANNLTVNADGYIYYYNNGTSWEPLGDNRTSSVIQQLGNAIVAAIWNPDTGLSAQITQEVTDRSSAITAITSWQGQKDTQLNGMSSDIGALQTAVSGLNSGMASKVDVREGVENAFATLFANAVDNDGDIVKQADIQAFVRAVNGVIESGVKINADKVIFAAGMVLLEDSNHNVKFGIDSNGNVYMVNASVAGTFVNGDDTFGVRIKDTSAFTSPRSDYLSNYTTRGGLLSIFARTLNDPSNTYRGIYCEGEAEIQGVTQLLKSNANKNNANIDALIVEGVNNKGNQKIGGKTIISSYVSTDAANYTLTDSTVLLVCNRNGEQNVTVPSSGTEGQVIWIKKTNSDWCYIKDRNGNVINQIAYDRCSAFIVYNGSTWI